MGFRCYMIGIISCGNCCFKKCLLKPLRENLCWRAKVGWPGKDKRLMMIPVATCVWVFLFCFLPFKELLLYDSACCYRTLGVAWATHKLIQRLEYLTLYGERPLSLCVFLMMLLRLYSSVTVLDIIYWIKLCHFIELHVDTLLSGYGNQFTSVTLMLDRCGTEKNPLLMTL